MITTIDKRIVEVQLQNGWLKCTKKDTSETLIRINAKYISTSASNQKNVVIVTQAEKEKHEIISKDFYRIEQIDGYVVIYKASCGIFTSFRIIPFDKVISIRENEIGYEIYYDEG